MWLCFGPQSLFRKGSLAADVLGGAEAGECAEVANHVRLIAIPAFEGEGWPIRYSASSNEHQRALNRLTRLNNFGVMLTSCLKTAIKRR
jgi:hypothetical protein